MSMADGTDAVDDEMLTCSGLPGHPRIAGGPPRKAPDSMLPTILNIMARFAALFSSAAGI